MPYFLCDYFLTVFKSNIQNFQTEKTEYQIQSGMRDREREVNRKGGEYFM